MSEVKTRFWVRVPPEPAQGAAASPAQDFGALVPADPAGRRLRTLPAATPARVPAGATRTYPIEALLRDLEQKRAKTAPAPARDGAPRARSEGRRGLLVRTALGLGLLLVLGTLLATVGPRAATSPGAPPPLPRAAPVTAASALAPLDAGETAHAPSGTVLPPGLERAAVDALIAGDGARSRALYAQLAGLRPDEPAYAVMLRLVTVEAHHAR